jgi:hypothetical protein
MPAGAKVLGRLAQVSPSGDVAIQFSRVEMPDGASEKLDALAMDLNFKPLKGYVSGKKTGTKFLVRSLTGLGTVASYLVGPQASSSAGLISTNVLMRERLADNVASKRRRSRASVASSSRLLTGAARDVEAQGGNGKNHEELDCLSRRCGLLTCWQSCAPDATSRC